MADYSISAELELDTSGYQSGINNAEKSTKSFSCKIKDAIEKVGNNGLTKSMANLSLAVGGVKTAMSGITKVIQGVSKAVKECSDAYKTQYKAEVQLETAAKNNPFLSSSSVKQLEAYASEMQKISTMGDEQILPYMAQLAAAGRSQEQIQKIVKTALDVSASGAMSFESAVKNLNKTYSGLAGEIGESIPDIKTLTAEQLKNGEAIDLVASKYAGLAEATAKATGSTEQLKNAWGDFKENIGKGFEEVLAPVRNGINGIITKLNEAIAKKNELNEAKEDDASGDADIAQYNLLITEQAKKIADLTQQYNAYINAVDMNGMPTHLEEAELVAKQIKDEQALAKQYADKLHYLELLANIEEKRAQALADADAEAAAQAERDKIALEAKQKYAETLAIFEQEIELRRAAGEEISKEQYLQEKINVVKSAFIQMVKDGQGYITKENEGYKEAVELLAQLNTDYEQLTSSVELITIGEQRAMSYAEQYEMSKKKAAEYAQKCAEEQAKQKQETQETNEETEQELSTFEKIKMAIKEITGVVKDVFSTISDVARKAFSTFKSMIGFSIVDAEDALLEFEDKVLTFFTYTLPQLPEFFANAFNSLRTIFSSNYKVWLNDGVKTFKKLFSGIIKFLQNYIDSGGFKELVDVVMKTFKEVLLFILNNLDELVVIAIKMSTDIVSAVIEALPEILVALVEAIPTVIIELFKSIPDIVLALVEAIGKMLKNSVETIGNKIKSGWDSFTDWLGFATGTNNAPRGLAVVGEQGPELIDFKGGERVYTANNTKQILSGAGGGGSSFNVTFNNLQDTSASAMMRELRRYNRELAINGVI